MEAQMSVVAEVLLHCTEGSSDKLYRVQTVTKDGTFGVRADNCRRGNPWTDQGYKVNGVTEPEAMKAAVKLIKSKTAKGYKIIEESNTGTAPVPPGAEQIKLSAREFLDTGIKPQLLNMIDEAEVPYYIKSPNYAMEEKHDGVRHLIRLNGGQVEGFNKKGQPTTVDGEVAMAVLKLRVRQCVLDGELVRGHFHIFDLLECEGSDLRELPFRERRRLLIEVMETNHDDAISRVASYDSPTTKQEYFDTCKAGNCEGVVFKHLGAKHTAGRPSSGGDQLKFKFYATASFICSGQNGLKRSVSLVLLDGSKVPVPVGSVTIPPNHKVPVEGAIVEVRYLYAFPGGSIFQSIYLGERSDVDAGECLLSQLKFKAGTVDDEE
jgi:bifunctional non-homologous end joining protein LigD